MIKQTPFKETASILDVRRKLKTFERKLELDEYGTRCLLFSSVSPYVAQTVLARF